MDLSKYFGLAPNHEPRPAKKASKKPASRTKKRSSVKSTVRAKSAALAAAMKLVKFHPMRNRTARRGSKASKRAETKRVIQAKQKAALNVIDTIIELPVFLISAHSGLCPFKGTCYGSPSKPTFTIPKGAYVVTFAQAGEAACPSEHAIVGRYEDIQRYLFLHSEGDIANNNRGAVGKSHFSLFSGIRRAVGPIEYSNINYTINDGDKKRSENPYGVYEISDDTIWRAFKEGKLNNTRSVIPQDLKRNDFTLEQIIDEVYAAKGIRSAIFISGGCLVSADDPEKISENDPKRKEKQKEISDYLLRHGHIMDRANAEYVNMQDVFTSAELEALDLDTYISQHVGVHALQAFPQPSELIEGIEEGLYNKGTMANLPGLVHHENRPVLEKEFRFKFKPF